VTRQTDDASTRAAGVENTHTLTRMAASLSAFGRTFVSLLHAPAAFWIIIGLYAIDAIAYFGNITLMEEYIKEDLKAGDVVASITLSIFTGLVSLFMLGIGELGERLGIRRGLLLAAFLCIVGRAAYAGAPLLSPSFTLDMIVLVGGLLVVAVGEGIIQPVAYAGVKYYTNERNSSVAYGLIYGVMNLGIFFIGWLSPAIRVPVTDILAARAAGTPEPHSIWRFFADWGISGINGVNWICVAVSILAFFFLLVSMTKRREAAKISVPGVPRLAARPAAGPELSLGRRLVNYFAEGPFSNARFVFFVFMLLPVQTLFAHQFLTMPPYILRAYPKGVSDHMELIVNWINPAIVFIGSPIIAALTRRVGVYTLMIVGTFVSAVPTFLLSHGPNLTFLIVNQVLFAIGEALWSPRFYQYAAELAPEGKVAQYMGLANLQWFAAKMTTGFYSGWFLAHYCPEGGTQDTGTMWTIYGLVALISPIGLLLGRKWVMSGTMGTPKPKAAT